MQVRRRVRGLCGLAAALLLAAGLVTWPASAAQAHAMLVDTDPRSGDRLDAAPAQVRLAFNEPVSVAPDGVRLQRSDGAQVPTPPPEVDPQAPTEVVLPVPAELPEDTYLVRFRVISADSHPVSGAIVFSVGVPVTPLAELDPDTDDPALLAVFAGARWLGYAGLALLTGALAVFVLCWPTGWRHRRARRLVRAGWAGSAASAASVLLLQGPYAAGRDLSATADPALLAATLDSGYGRYVLARLGLLMLAALLLSGPGAGWLARAPRLRATAALLLVVALPATWVGTGHTSTGGPVDMLVDTAHLVAMTGWFGGLVLLAVCLLPHSAAPPGAETGPALRRFSLLATGSVAALVVTGLYIAWREVGSFAALAGTAYGRLLAFKLAAVGVLLWLGAISRAVVQRRPVRATRLAADRARQQLRQTVRLEVGTAVAVLAIVAVLVATPPGVVVTAGGVEPAAAEPAAAEPVLESAPLTGAGAGEDPAPDEGTLRVLVDPARVGENRVVISVWDPDGQLREVPEVRASLALPEQELGPLALTLEQLGPGEYEAPAAQLPAAGTWQLDVTVRTSEIDSFPARVEIPVS